MEKSNAKVRGWIEARERVGTPSCRIPEKIFREQLEESERSEDPCPSVLGGKKKGRVQMPSYGSCRLKAFLLHGFYQFWKVVE